MEAVEGQVMLSWTCGLSRFNKALPSPTPAKASHSQGWHTTQLMERRVPKCVCRCLCVSTVWTNISNWAINHRSSRSFNLVGAWVWGRLNVLLFFLHAGAFFRGSGWWLDSTCGIRGIVAALVFWHIRLEEVLSGGEQTRCKKMIQGQIRGEKDRSATLSPNQQGASRFPTPSYATFPRQRAHG